MTSSWFAQTAVFAAHAAVCEGDDADLPKGTHLRVFPAADIGFPLAPMGIWNMPTPSDCRRSNSSGSIAAVDRWRRPVSTRPAAS